MNLDLVLGMSCHNIGCLACDQNSGLLAHTASGVLVVLNTKTNCQVKYFHVRKNCVSSVSFSSDGRYVTTGETGYRPAVRVWRIKDGSEVATLYGHEFGIKCVQFCPTMSEIISVGLEHDNVVNVWAWPAGHRIAVNKIADVIRAVTYSECGSFFVTAGCRHIKFWYPKLTLEHPEEMKTTPRVQPLYGRLGLLGDCKDHTFIDVACGNGASADTVFTITRAGGLIILCAKSRQLKSHKSIDGVKGTCIKAHDRVLFIGFNNGDVHMFNAVSLAHLGALPVPTFFRRTGLNGGGVFTLTFNLSTSFLTTAYRNASICVWDMRDAENIKQKYVAVYHSASIAKFDFFSSREASGTVIRETLVTVSHDSTVRLWGILIDNVICYDRLNIFYADDGSLRAERQRSQTLDHSGEITAIKVSPDRKFIVTGNKTGTICVYNKATFTHCYTVKAHNREITCLTFYFNPPRGHVALVSGSRDRLIKVIDAAGGFHVVSTLSIHSSSITSLRVCQDGTTVRIVSTAADRSIGVSQGCLKECPPSPTLTGHPSPSRKLPTFQLSKCAACVSSPTDMAVDPLTKEIAVGCQDGNIRVMEPEQLQEKRVFAGSTTTEAQVNKVDIDPYGALLLSAALDKTINVINFHTGQILHTVTGHNRCVTGLAFTSKGDHVISTSMDGCIFLWRLTSELITKRLEICLASASRCTVSNLAAIEALKPGMLAMSDSLSTKSLPPQQYAGPETPAGRVQQDSPNAGRKPNSAHQSLCRARPASSSCCGGSGAADAGTLRLAADRINRPCSSMDKNRKLHSPLTRKKIAERRAAKSLSMSSAISNNDFSPREGDCKKIPYCRSRSSDGVGGGGGGCGGGSTGGSGYGYQRKFLARPKSPKSLTETSLPGNVGGLNRERLPCRRRELRGGQAGAPQVLHSTGSQTSIFDNHGRRSRSWKPRSSPRMNSPIKPR